jgi:hypothetical protein
MMNLDNYEDVQARITRWYGNHPTARISTRLEHIYTDDQGGLVSCVVSASVYRDQEDAQPAGTGLAQEHRTDRGVNVAFALENCETSAIGRAIVNAGLAPATGQRPSRQEMEKAAAVKTRKAAPQSTAPGRGDEGVAADIPLSSAVTPDPSPTMGEAIGNVVDAMPGSRIIEQGETPAPAPAQDPNQVWGVAPGNVQAAPSEKQLGLVKVLLRKTGLTDPALARTFVADVLGGPVAFDALTKGQASDLITALKEEEDRQANSAPDEAKYEDPWAGEPGAGF